MPAIYDNIEAKLLPQLQKNLDGAVRADCCVGYFRLSGWNLLADCVEKFQGGDGHCCRLLVGMHRAPEEEMRQAQSVLRQDGELDLGTVKRLKRRATESFKEQLEFGTPTSAAEVALRRLARQLRARKVRVKLFLNYPLHAKLYLVHRNEFSSMTGYLGSSNLTISGLDKQGELNTDITDQQLCAKLQTWFDDRWDDPQAFDISDELADLIENSWAREKPVAPFHVYLKMAYHLCEDARQGSRTFRPPPILEGKLLKYQFEAVSLAARLLHVRGGVLLGDVVGLGKTMMATAVAKIFEVDGGGNTLIVCPPKLEKMWEWHRDTYKLNARVLSLGAVIGELPDLSPYNLVIIDESHNLRNRESKRYRAVRDYLARHESETFRPRVMLLTATPYNKQFLDLGSQVRLFANEDDDLRVRPEKFFAEWQHAGHNEADFIAQFQVSPRSIRAFEQSLHADDWRDLMRLFLVRRTRSFIKRVYAQHDVDKDRHYVMLGEERFYFPERVAKRLEFALDESDPNDHYARLYGQRVVSVIGNLNLPRYGLVHHLVENPARGASADEKRVLENLNRAGRRLLGFCRTNLFKRLESNGYSFLLSLERHVLRNMVALHALDKKLPLPVGTQEAAMLDALVKDVDVEAADASDEADDETSENETSTESGLLAAATTTKGKGYNFDADLDAYKERAAKLYAFYQKEIPRKFRWLPAKFFKPSLKTALLEDAKQLIGVLQAAREWLPARDAKLDALFELLQKTHPREKVLVFTQFADTALYLGRELKARGLTKFEVVTSEAVDPVATVRRFSPNSNGGLPEGETELRVLIATDVLSEGQNLQDAHVVVNFDLPWAIIRLIQRAGRVDRIGQKHDTIQAYSFLPAEGVDDVINLRKRLSERLQQNEEVVGSDESFFGEDAAHKLRDLYTGRAGILDDDEDADVDLSSVALQVWNGASEADRRAVESLPPVIAAARSLADGKGDALGVPGAVAYLRFPDGTDALVRVNPEGEIVSQSVSATFAAVACPPDTVSRPHAPDHHELVVGAVVAASQEGATPGGQLGSLRSTRRKVYERLKRYRESLQGRPTLFSQQSLQHLEAPFNALFRFPLSPYAREALSRQLRLGMNDEELARMVVRLHDEERLCQVLEEASAAPEPQIVCSLGLLPEE